jgi:hypothetical protein
MKWNYQTKTHPGPLGMIQAPESKLEHNTPIITQNFGKSGSIKRHVNMSRSSQGVQKQKPDNVSTSSTSTVLQLPRYFFQC